MKKILLIQNVISHYRVPVYNLIAENYDLTVMYSNGKVPDDCKFKTLHVPVKEYKHFIVHQEKIRNIANQYDAVIGMMAFNWISNYMLAFGKRKYKFIPWGIGVPASYSVRYDDPHKKINRFLIKWLIRKSDAVVFYSDYPKDKYSKLGIKSEKMFVAHNTVAVKNIGLSNNKDSILFVGTLYKAKSVMKMLNLYHEAHECNNVPLLRIVGSGDEFEDIKKWINENKMNQSIVLEGAVYDENVLAKFFSQAFACVSLGQAGLSVQKAMGYGVPYITTEDAYTGGERLDIEDGKNGYLLKDENEFRNVMIDLAKNPQKYIKAGEEAYKFYHKHRTIEQMAKGVLDALDYACE